MVYFIRESRQSSSDSFAKAVGCFRCFKTSTCEPRNAELLSDHRDIVLPVFNLLTAITSRVATFISASSKVHVTIEYHVMCLVFCMYSTLYSVQYGEILLS